MNVRALHESNGELQAFLPVFNCGTSPRVAVASSFGEGDRRPDHPLLPDPAGNEALREYIERNGWPA